MPSGFTSKRRTIDVFEKQLDEAIAPMSVAIIFEDDIDVGMGDMILKSNNRPKALKEITIMLRSG